MLSVDENSGAETIFGQEGQNLERQIDGIFIEFGPRFCPRNKRSLKKGFRRIWKKNNTIQKGLCRLPTAFVWLRIQFSKGAQVVQGDPKYFRGRVAAPLLPAPMDEKYFKFYSFLRILTKFKPPSTKFKHSKWNADTSGPYSGCVPQILDTL